MLTPEEWAQLATTLNPLQVTVAGISTNSPTMKGTSAAIYGERGDQADRRRRLLLVDVDRRRERR